MYIYKTTCLVNGIIYIGQSTNKPEQNPKYLGSGYFIDLAIRLYGRANFTKEILCHCATQAALDKMEEYFIKKFNATKKGIGYNILPGAAKAPMLISGVAAKVSKTLQERQCNVGINNPNYGNVWNKQQRENLSVKKSKIILMLYDGIVIGEFVGSRKAAKALNTSRGNILNAIFAGCKAKGYNFKFKDYVQKN